MLFPLILGKEADILYIKKIKDAVSMAQGNGGRKSSV